MQDPVEKPARGDPTPSLADVVAPAGAAPIVDDEAIPDVVPLVLRRTKAVVVGDAVTSNGVAALDGSLIDSLTRIINGMLEVHVRESVTAAVRALAPRLVVGLAADQTIRPDGDAQVRARPVHERRSAD